MFLLWMVLLETESSGGKHNGIICITLHFIDQTLDSWKREFTRKKLWKVNQPTNILMVVHKKKMEWWTSFFDMIITRYNIKASPAFKYWMTVVFTSINVLQGLWIQHYKQEILLKRISVTVALHCSVANAWTC